MKTKTFYLLFFVLFISWYPALASASSQIAAGGNHAVVIRPDGSLWIWGENTSGQLGDGTTTPKDRAVKIDTAVWKQVAAGESHTLAIKKDGTLWGWGFNQYGQLGDGTWNNQSRPVRVGSANNWLSVAAGAAHSVAVKTDGTLWAWGVNFSGQLGDGTTVNRNLPFQIGTASDWRAAAAGESHSLAVKSDGTLWSWGDNQYGQLGDGTTVQREKPVRVGGASSNWQTVTAGYSHSLAIRTDGTLWTWGDNQYGQLGDGTTERKNKPVQISTASWQSLAAGRFHAAAVRSDGTLWTWGYNEYGQLGDGTRTNHSAPVQIGTAANWQEVAAGKYHVAALQKDDTLWTWGYNNYGQLGDGTAELKNLPAQISIVRQYIDHGDGTIADKKTGLMWKRCSEGLSGVNCEKGVVEKYTWDNAVNRFKNVAYAGYSDWRLPTFDELKTLVSCSKGQNERGWCNDGSEKPTINQQAFPNTEWNYWSGSSFADGSSSAWYVDFFLGGSDAYFRTFHFEVRLVRGGQ
uniref:RCC1 domain-containing protein n=1 Tax=Candidatus Electronema sp. TaxID=2698783 RepID=UPI004056BE71